MKQLTKRILSLALCLVLIVGITPTYALSGDAEPVPSDASTVTQEEGNDFPEYPNQGAIRIDKTAQAVGTFSQTGMAKVELSMTGVPYSTGSEVDVVLVLDASDSMYDEGKGTRVAAAKEAAYDLIQQICVNKDGTFNNNRVAIVYFGSSDNAAYPVSGLTTDLKQYKYSTNYGFALSSLNSLDDIYSVLYGEGNYPKLGSTNYSNGLAIADAVLSNARSESGYDRQQICVFMSDGKPTGVRQVKSFDANGKPTNWRDGDYTLSTSNGNLLHEYYSSMMKYEGVHMYCVGTAMAQDADQNVYTLMQNMASSADDLYYVSQEDVTNGALQNAFGDIAKKITQAATDVIVEDQLSDDYTMIFDVPTGPKTIDAVNEDFCIEFVEYNLDADNERTGAPTSVNKLKLVKNGNTYSANASAPVFEQKTLGDKGTKYYWTTDASKSTDGIQVNGYYFTKNGDGTHNMTSGAYANGTINANNMSENLIIATPYYVYNASSRMLYWTVDKLTTTEYALSYYVYLKDSATHIGEYDVRPAGTYPTNDHATISYTNHLKNDVSKAFPVPKMAWNGAQVSYVFYLVNEDGQPINSAGQVVDFANAVFVTDIFTKNVIWNDTDTPTTDAGTAYLDADYEAGKLLSEGYTPYDAAAKYELKVYEDAEGNDLDSYFTIDGADGKAGTTKVYNTKAGDKYTNYGTYTKSNVSSDFDFANTTVAFGVVWSAKLVEDTVVVDYGLDTLIDVTRNDLVTSSVSGIGGAVTNYGKDMNTGLRTEGAVLGNNDVTINGHTISIEDRNTIRFHQGNMSFNDAVKFYYESPVTYYEDTAKKTGHMYSSVTVIPATTVYYEDSFVDFKSYTKDASGKYVEDGTSKWTQDGTEKAATQQQDRPGENKISEAIDADNPYGYDSAYADSSLYSLGSAKKIDVTSDVRGEATFSFYGTGFDIVGLTSNKTGTLIVQVYAGKEATGTAVKTSIVDTYYGYTQNEDGEWVTVGSDASNALYQVPVMKIFDLPYGQYTVKLTAGYNSAFDHTSDTNGDYTLYVDAIRIYDPANGGASNQVIKDAYVADGEAYPVYTELRDELLSSEEYANIGDTDVADGIVFIDGKGATATVADYKNYGPNNELYLQSGQTVAFDLNANGTTPAGKELASVQLAIKSVGGAGEVEVYAVDKETKAITACLDESIGTATDLYYDITKLNGKTVVIKNAGTSATDATISLTNIKTTYADAATAARTVASTTGESLLTVTRAGVNAALLSLYEDAVIYSVKTDKDAYTVKDSVEATIRTNAATQYITVNGEKITEFTEADGERIWTYSVKTAKTGSVTLKTVAYNEVEKASREVSTTVNVKKFTPKTFKLAVNKTSVTIGDKVKATVTTSTDVKYVTINGKKVTKYTYSKSKGTRTWTSEVKTSKVGKMTFKAVAYNSNDSASAPATKTVTVKKFAPKTFKVTLSKSKVKVGTKYTVTVKTSTDVKYVKVNGTKVTKYVYSKSKGTKTFKMTYKASKAGKKTVKVVSYNKAGYASSAKTKTVTITKR